MKLYKFPEEQNELKQVWNNMPKIMELLKIKAHLAYQGYLFLRECGFTKSEALALCLKMSQSDD